MQISINVEAGWGLTWERWRKVAAKVEELGFAGLYRSDHFPGSDATLELIVSLTYLAQATERIHFSPLVAPLSFRDPRMLVRQAAAIDDLSGGRLILGLGTGWQPEEHATWGYPLGDMEMRYGRFEEGLQIITHLLRSDEPLTVDGDFFRLKDAVMLPRPARPGGPPILIGGNGLRRTLPLVARYADIWNANNLSVAAIHERNDILDRLLLDEGRKPGDLKRTAMVLCWCGRDDEEIIQRIRPLHQRVPHLADLPLAEQLAQIEEIFTPVLERAGAMFSPLVGTPERVISHVRAFEEAGVTELVIQWLNPDDLEGLELLAEEVLPEVTG